MQFGSHRKKKAGFTIFEVAMAAAVMAMAISTSLLVMGRGFASLDSARCISYASQIMQSEMEKMRLSDWHTVSAVYERHDPTNPTDLGEAVTITSSLYTGAGDLGSRMTLRRFARVVPAHVADGEMIEVTLRITWTTFDRRTITRSYVTYYAKDGLYDYFAA